MPQVLVTLAVEAATKTTSKSSSSAVTFLLLIVLVGVFYFFIIRPRSQRQRQAREQIRAAQVGDEISTIGGLVGTIVSEDGDRVTVSTGNGTELVFLRQAIGRKLEPAEPTPVVEDTEFQGPPPGFDEEPKSGETDAK